MLEGLLDQISRSMLSCRCSIRMYNTLSCVPLLSNLPKSHIFISPKRFHCKYGVPRHTQCVANKYPAPTFGMIAHPVVR